MTLVQTQSRPTRTNAVHRTVSDAADAAGPQVRDDTTVEVALSVMAAARTGRLLVRDEDGRRTGPVTRARLTAVRRRRPGTRPVADEHGNAPGVLALSR
ncbi:CBS domain-containing protein [Streptomyces sp. QTS137]